MFNGRRLVAGIGLASLLGLAAGTVTMPARADVVPADVVPAGVVPADVVPAVAPAAATLFTITGGTARMVLNPQFLTALDEQGATLQATGAAALTVESEGAETVLTMPVKRKKFGIGLAQSCRCMTAPLAGTLTVSGNGATKTLEALDLQINDSAVKTMLIVTVAGRDQSWVSWGVTPLPRTIKGKRFRVSLGAGSVTAGGMNVFTGYVRYPGEPGDGPAPTFAYSGPMFDEAVVSVTVKPEE